MTAPPWVRRGEHRPSNAAWAAANAIADDFAPGFCDDVMVLGFARHIDAAFKAKLGGRKRALSEEQEDNALWYYTNTSMSMSDVARRFRVSLATMQRALQRAGARAGNKQEAANGHEET